ncbi:MAG: class I SAM-dependent methyltransferase [Candidatus Loosdrechtia sp.]|uniref:class I SAM-dependent methyltransferase n=1 Tax=Candidatus Loosdrechtia sp. TaxID=3101272 RepID=UPI003A742A93|nr:MAG: methyltransferase domain-containing protein [Candidatus Jettenia sp. AMX2]
MKKNNKPPQSIAEFNVAIHRSKGIGTWRTLYKHFLDKLNIDSIIEVGVGSLDFLKEISCCRKVAMDAGNSLKEDFKSMDIEFIQADLDKSELPDPGMFDVAVCSDVFEHLIYPERTLKYIKDILKEHGFLFSHVPNEYRFLKTLSIMTGLSEGLYFHKHCEEYNDPHLRRFTKIGFEKFLKREFKYNLFIGDLRYGLVARMFKIFHFIPYAVEGGPTFISTNDKVVFEQLRKIKNEL